MVLANQLLEEPAPTDVGILGQPCQPFEHLVVHGERAASALALPLFCIQTSNVVVPSYSAGAVSARSRSNSRAALAAFAGGQWQGHSHGPRSE